MKELQLNDNMSTMKKILIVAIIIQVVVFLVVLYLLLNRVINYYFNGNTILRGEVASKCEFEYKCKCPDGAGKCDCLYYSENDEVEKIKCDRTPELIS